MALVVCPRLSRDWTRSVPCWRAPRWSRSRPHSGCLGLACMPGCVVSGRGLRGIGGPVASTPVVLAGREQVRKLLIVEGYPILSPDQSDGDHFALGLLARRPQVTP
jgi:hypothetical protein